MTTRRALLSAALLAPFAGPTADPFAEVKARTTKTILLGGPFHSRLLDSVDEIAPDLETGPRPELAVYAGSARIGEYVEQCLFRCSPESDPTHDRRGFVFYGNGRYDEAIHQSNRVRVVRVVKPL